MYKATCREKLVTVHILRNQNLNREQLDEFWKYVKILFAIKHPNICLFMGATTDDKIGIVTEYIPKNFSNLFNRSDINLYSKLQIATNIVLAMTWIHSIKVIHGDLCPENILIDYNLEAKISDYGIASTNLFEEDEDVSLDRLVYRAPEVLKGQEVSFKSDIYSFGMILWSIVTNKRPFELIQSKESLLNAIENNILPDMTEIPKDLSSLISDCIDLSPNRRLPFESVGRRLGMIVVDSVVTDRGASMFWKKTFTNRYNVEWVKFIVLLCRYLRIVQRKDNIVKILRDPNKNVPEDIRLGIACLKSLLASQNDIVELETFGRVASWFGPIHPSQSKKFFERIIDTLKQTWFHGDISIDETFKLLCTKPIGTFLVRFSKTEGYTLSVNREQGIVHRRFQYNLTDQKYYVGTKSYETMNEMIADQQYSMRCIYPCLGSRFMNIFSQNSGDYIEDITT